jgi:hypothetical protein
MTAVQWYYTRGQQQCGPVSSAELKRLADQGELTADALVWRDGMKDWLPARGVKGLFDAEGTLPKATPLLAETPPAAPPAATPGPTTHLPPGPATGTGETPAPPRGETPSPARAPAATFEHSPAAFQRSREGKPSHLFDFLLASGRAWFTPQFVDSAARLFAGVGHYGLYGAMVLVLAYDVTMAVQTKATFPAMLGLAEVLALAGLQYAARRFLAASERLSRVTPAKMGSSALADCTAILFAIAGLAILIGVTILALLAGAYARIAAAIAGFIVCEYVAIASMNPECLSLSITSDAGAHEEFLGSFSFLGKLLLSMAPVAFGVGVVWGMMDIGVVWAWPPPSTPSAAAPGLGGLAGLIAPATAGLEETLKGLSQDLPELRGKKWGLSGFGALQGAAASAPSFPAKIGLLFAAAFPLLAYWTFLVLNFVVDLFYSILSIPGKLDRLRRDEGNDQESQ